MLYQAIRKFLFCLLLLCTQQSIAWGHATYTNEPAGSTPIAECAFDTADFCNAQKGGLAIDRWFDFYNSGVFETDGGDTISPPGTINAILPYTGPCNNGGVSSLPCGIGGMHFGYITGAAQREIFVGTNIWIPSGYGCNLSGSSKWLFVRDVDNPQGFIQTNGVFYIRGCGATKQVIFSHNGGNHDNSHTCGEHLGLTCFPNAGPGTITEGTWAKVEACIRSSSSLTSRDGVVKWWVNGVLAGSYTNFNYGNGNVNEVIYQQTWDGFGNGQGFTQTIRQRFGDIYISAVPAGGCSGVPVTPDTIAPTQVTGASISNITASSMILSWTAAVDNVGVAGYNIERCTGVGCTSYVSLQSTTGTGVSRGITGLSPATSYSFRIKGRDAAGNVSAQYSIPVTATTLSPGSGTVVRNTLATDNFNRADNADLGTAWDGDYYVTGATAPLRILNNKLSGSVATTKEGNETYNAVTLPSDHWGQVTLATWAADANKRYAWVNVRAGAPQVPSYYQCQAVRNDASGYTVIIERENGNGVYTNLETGSGVVWAAGDTLTCEAIGLSPTIINLYRNGTLALSASDNNSLTGLRTGAGIWTASLAAVELDDFLTGDFTGTALPVITSAETDTTGANITWAGGPVSIRVNYDAGQQVVSVASLVNGRFNFVWPIDTTFACFFAIDAQGNVNTLTSDYVCTTVVPGTSDITPPTVSGPSPSGTLAAGTTATTLGVVTSEAAVCKYATSAGVAYSAMTGTFMTPVSSTQHSASVTGLSNNTTYTYYVKCTDPAGNITPADTVLSFSVNASPTDIIAPTQPTAVVGTALNANQVQLSFTPATDDAGVAGYQVFACITDSCITYDLVANGGGSPIIVNGLQSNTSYNFKLRAFDAVQNLGDFSSVVVVITPILDTIAPSRLLNLVATRTGYDAFLLTWDPGTDDNQIAGAAIEICVGDGCNVFKLQYIATGRTSITINGLASQLPYYFRGKHIDSAGNVSEEYSELAKGEPFPLQSGTVQGVCACQIP